MRALAAASLGGYSLVVAIASPAGARSSGEITQEFPDQGAAPAARDEPETPSSACQPPCEPGLVCNRDAECVGPSTADAPREAAPAPLGAHSPRRWEDTAFGFEVGGTLWMSNLESDLLLGGGAVVGPFVDIEAGERVDLRLGIRAMVGPIDDLGLVVLGGGTFAALLKATSVYMPRFGTMFGVWSAQPRVYVSTFSVEQKRQTGLFIAPELSLATFRFADDQYNNLTYAVRFL